MNAFLLKNLTLFFLVSSVATIVFSQTPEADSNSGPAQIDSVPVDANFPIPVDDTTESPETQYTVMLNAKPLSVAYADALAEGHTMSDDEQRAYVANLRNAQSALVNDIAALGGREISRVSVALNAIFISAGSDVADQVASLDGVRSVKAVVNLYTQSLPSSSDFKEVVPLIGANTLRDSGIDGTGVRIAVLDSGIDYTHAAFGGAGTADAFLAAYGTSPSASENKSAVAWPRGRVAGGYDFVGEVWPAGPLAPDPNPIAAPPSTNALGIFGTNGSHGTSVSDIIAGAPFPDRPDNHGVAPGALLYAVKVCSAVSSSCSGIAIVQGVEWALDPDGDGSMSDAVDVINLSLGGDYGLKENSSAEAVNNAARVGVVVCCAAGNAGDIPYVVSSPSIAPEVISVAQTTQPSAKVFSLAVTSNVPPSPISITDTNTLSWAPIVGTATGIIAIPDSTTACSRLPAGSLAGKIALVDLPGCNISFKVAYAQDAGAIGVILAYPVPGSPGTFSFGGIPADLPPDFVISIPALLISGTDGTPLKARLSAGEILTATLSDAAGTSVASNIATTSSRGLSSDFSTIKPEIGAPGANLAAVAGTGTGFATFGGTSGATPVISGSAALLRQQYPGISPLEVKARLMNTAEINVYQNSATQPGVYVPISRIGAGEVRTLSAVQATAAAWTAGEAGDASVPALSFGTWRLSGPESFTKTVRVKNYAAHSRTFTVVASSRFSPGILGAVSINVPDSITVNAGEIAEFPVTLVVTPSLLPTWNTDSGFNAADGLRLAALEYGGFVTISEGSDTLRLPWEILPHKANRALVSTSNYTLGTPAPTITNNNSGLSAVANAYALTGTSPRISAGLYPSAGSNFEAVDLHDVGVRLVNAPLPLGPILEFAITTWDRRASANFPARLRVNLDVNRDGITDWILETTNSAGRNVAFLRAAPWATGFGTFTTTVDFNSANMVLQVPLNRIGLTIPPTPSGAVVPDPMPPTQPFSFTVQALDLTTGRRTDQIGPMTFTPSSPKYILSGAQQAVGILPGGTASLPIVGTGSASSPSQTGILLLFANGRTNFESKAITVTP